MRQYVVKRNFITCILLWLLSSIVLLLTYFVVASITQAEKCCVDENIMKLFPHFDKKLPVIFMITATFRRAEQLPELVRTAQTLLHVKNLVWIVSEEGDYPSPEILEYLEHSGTNYIYIRVPSPTYKGRKPIGVVNRNAAFKWIRENSKDGVVYMGDDDNTYDLRIFEEIRTTKHISMFPVGLAGEFRVSAPMIKNGRIVAFYDSFQIDRTFPVDMAGFAINVRVFHEHPEAEMPISFYYQESGFLLNLGLKKEDIEFKAQNCTKVWVWHTQTVENPPADEKKWKLDVTGTNIEELRKSVWYGK